MMSWKVETDLRRKKKAKNEKKSIRPEGFLKLSPTMPDCDLAMASTVRIRDPYLIVACAMFPKKTDNHN